MNLLVTSLLFFPESGFYDQPAHYGLIEKEVFLTPREGVKLHGWYFEVERSPAVLLFLHGNAGNISGRLHKAKLWVERGISVLMIDYRGFGKSGGKIERASDLVEDAASSLKWIEENFGIPAQRVLVYGESIGSFPAIQLAVRQPLGGLVLEAPFTSLRELARTHYPWVPDFILKDFEMDNEGSISGAKAPVFVLHGDQDETCPFEMGERLYEAAPAPKEFFRIRNGNHNNLPEAGGASYVETPYRFLAKENGFENK